MQRMRCVGRGNRPCSLPDVGICFCGRPLGAVLTQGVSGSGEDAPSNSSGDYVCRQFELLYPEEPHTSYLVASLHRALESTYVFKNKLTPQTAKTNSTQYPLNGSAGAPPAPPTFATRGAPPSTSADASFAAANAAGQVPSGAEVPAGAEGAALAGLLGLPQEGGSAPSSSPQQAKRPFEPHEGERAGPRVRYCYELTKCLGVGASGQVYECIQRDVQNNLKPLRVVAAKLVRNTPAHICNGLNELIIYQVMPKREGSRSVIEHLEFFVYRRHLCFILEILQTDLYQVLKAGKFKGLPLPCVQSIAAQIVGTLRVATDARITHFDLKPENILITLDEEETNTNLPNSKPTQGDHAGHLGASSAAREASAETDSSLFLDAAVPLGGDVPPALKYNNLKSARVKVIDFSASRLWMHRGFPRAAGKEEHVQYVKDIVSAARCTTCYRIQTRYYGAPELLLGIPYYKVVDVWSVGCILAELVLGVPLFPGVSHFDLLRRITRICGSVPTWMLDHGSRVWKFYARDVVLSLPPTLGPPGVAEETAESAEDLKLLQHEETKQDASPSVPRSPTAWQEASPLGGGHSLLPVGGVTLCGPVNSASCKEGASGRSALSHAARGTSSRFSVAGPSAGLREAFGPARDRRGLCSRAVSEALEAEGDETRACFLNSRAAAALQLVRCFDRATEGGDCRCRLPRTALGGNSSSIFCERNGEDRGVGLGRATVAFSGVDGDRTSDREERETALGWRMLSIAEYEQKHNKVEPKTADLLNIREIRDVLRVRAENIRSFRGPCAACTRLARPAADLAAGAPDGAHAAADAPEEAAAPCADADGDKNVECSSCRDTRIQEDCLAADFLDFLERALVIDPLLRMTPEEAAAHPFVFRLGTSLDGEAPRRPRQSWGERQLNRVLCFMQEQLEALQQQQQAGLTATTHIASPLRLPLQLWKPQTFPCDWSGRDPPAAAAAAALQQQQQQQQLQESNGCTELPAFAGEAFGSPVQLGGIYSPSMALRCSSPLCLGSPPLVTLGGTSPRTGGLYAAGSPAVLPHSSPPLLALGSPATAFAAPYPHQIDPAAAHLLRAATTADLPMQQQQHLLMMRCSTPQQRMRSFLAQQQQLELLHQQQQQQQQQQHGTWKRGNLQQYHMSSGRPSLATRRNHRLESPRLLGSPLHAVGHEPQRSHWGRPPEGASVMPSAAWPGMGAAVAGGGPWADTHTNYSLTPERVSSQQQQQQQWEERNPRQSQCSMPLP